MDCLVKEAEHLRGCPGLCTVLHGTKPQKTSIIDTTVKESQKRVFFKL
jgi:hypothetical protein